MEKEMGEESARRADDFFRRRPTVAKGTQTRNSSQLHGKFKQRTTLREH